MSRLKFQFQDKTNFRLSFSQKEQNLFKNLGLP